MQFLIPNWDDVDAMNAMAADDLDTAMAGAGAIPAGVAELADSPRGAMYRVEVMRDDLAPQELLDIFEGLGYQVEVVGDEKLES